MYAESIFPVRRWGICETYKNIPSLHLEELADGSSDNFSDSNLILLRKGFHSLLFLCVKPDSDLIISRILRFRSTHFCHNLTSIRYANSISQSKRKVKCYKEILTI